MAVDFPVGADTRPAQRNIDELTAALRKTGREAGLAEDKIELMVNEVRKFGTTGVNSINSINRSLGGLENVVKGVQNKLVALFAVDKLIEFANYLVKITSEFQKYEALLTNTFGSKSAAFSAFVNIQAQAAKTNFSLAEVTNGYLKLANNGIAPTNDELTAFFDLTNNAGKGFDMFVEAVNDAVNGEFERLKEFFIKGSKDGDKITLMFKNQKFTVDNNAQSIKGLLVQLGKLQGVAGSTAAIASTLEGKISNFGDNIDQLVKSLGDRSSGAIGGFFDLANDALGALNASLNNNVKYLQREQAGINVLVAAITDVNVPTEVRAKLIEELNRKYPDFLRNLDAEKVTNEQLKERLEDVNEQFFRKIALTAAEERFKESQQDILDLIDKEVEKRKVLQEILQGQRVIKPLSTKGGAEGLSAEQAKAQAIFDLEEDIAEIQKERQGIQSELTNRLTEYNEALNIFNSTSNDYFEAEKKNIQVTEDREKAMKKLADAVNEYLAYLSDLELYQVEMTLKDAQEMREKAAKIQRENDRNSFLHWKYYDDLRRKKLAEAEEEEIWLLEQAALRKKQIDQAYADASINFADTAFQFRLSRIEQEIDLLSEGRSRELEAAGDNAEAKEAINKKFDERERQLRKRQAQEQQAYAIFSILVNQGPAVAQTIKNLGFPAAIPFVGLVLAQFALALSQSRSARYAADGEYDIEGPGTETSDSVGPYWLSRGESVTPARATRRFGFILKRMIEDPSFDLFDLKHLVDQRVPTEYARVVVNRNTGADSPEMLDELRRTRRALENQKQLHVTIDENGFKTSIREGDKWTTYVNNRYKF